MTVLVMQADSAFWDSLVFDGIDDVDVGGDRCLQLVERPETVAA
ncbi:hypothetical protein OHB14_60630 [Streptomyces sp. NBC_01613]